MVQRFFDLQRLAKLGFKFELNDYSAEDIESFIVIDRKIEQLQSKRMEAEAKKARGNSKSRPTR